MGNTFLQIAIKGLLFILSKMNPQLEHMAVTGLCVILFSHIFPIFSQKTKQSVEEALSRFPVQLSKGMNWPLDAL